jgi:hypothetical protein
VGDGPQILSVKQQKTNTPYCANLGCQGFRIGAHPANFALLAAVGRDGLSGEFLQVLYSGRFAFSFVSGFSSRISTYLLRGIALSPSCG